MNQPRDTRGRFIKKDQSGAKEQKVITGLKGFDENLRCMGMQYAEGQHFHVDGRIQICARGLHFCMSPLDVFNFYSPERSRFSFVEASGSFSFSEEAKSPFIGRGSKVAASDILVKKELRNDELADALVASASGLVLNSRTRRNVRPLFDKKFKYRPVHVQHRVATSYHDEQEILLINGVAVNNDTEGYAGAVAGYANAGVILSVTRKSRSIAYGNYAITLSENSVARGCWNAMAIGSKSIAYGDSIAVATGGWSVAIASSVGSVAVCGNKSKVILYGQESIGIVGSHSGAEVYNSHCVLMFVSMPDTDDYAEFILRDGTHLLLLYMGRVLDVVAGVDVKTTKTRDNVPVYTSAQIHDAFMFKHHHRGKK